LDPHHFNADSDQAFHFNADPDQDPAFHFNVVWIRIRILLLSEVLGIFEHWSVDFQDAF
jgi:hypothetical protein